tara:strand:+ start:33 stop:287 length:255 start_codon:yes stop_codon:yes gene_type:complete
MLKYHRTLIEIVEMEEEESLDEVTEDLAGLIKLKIRKTLNQVLGDQIQTILEIKNLDLEDQNLLIQTATPDLEKTEENRLLILS